MRKLILRFTLSIAIIGACQGNSLIGQQDSIWTLEKCINHALNRNIQVRKSELSNKQYQVYDEQAKAQRFPSANASISQNFNWSKSTATGVTGLTGNNGSNVSVNSGVTIFNASKLTNLIKQADLSIESGRYR